MNVWETNAGHSLVSILARRLQKKTKQTSIVCGNNHSGNFICELDEKLSKGYTVANTISLDDCVVVILNCPDS